MFQTILGVASGGSNREEILWLTDLLPKCYIYKLKHYQ